MDDDSLMPDVAEPLRAFEVLLTVPLDGDRGALAPPGLSLPPTVVGAWMATQALFSVPVKARGLMEATTLGLALCGDWADAPGATVTVRPVSP